MACPLINVPRLLSNVLDKVNQLASDYAFSGSLDLSLQRIIRLERPVDMVSSFLLVSYHVLSCKDVTLSY